MCQLSGRPTTTAKASPRQVPQQSQKQVKDVKIPTAHKSGKTKPRPHVYISKENLLQRKKIALPKRPTVKTTDILAMNVVERSEFWVSRREKRRDRRRLTRTESETRECTFRPVIYTKVPHRLHSLSHSELSGRSFASYTPLSRSRSRSRESSLESSYKRSTGYMDNYIRRKAYRAGASMLGSPCESPGV
jgi:hypothetical protein